MGRLAGQAASECDNNAMSVACMSWRRVLSLSQGPKQISNHLTECFTDESDTDLQGTRIAAVEQVDLCQDRQETGAGLEGLSS